MNVPQSSNQHSSPLDPNTGLNAAQIVAQSQLWRQEQLQTEQAAADGEAIADHQRMDEVVCTHQDSAQPLRAESPTRAKLRSHNKAPYEREARDISPAKRSLSRSRVSSRSPFPSPYAVPECYTVTSDVEDDYSKTRSTVELNREIKDHRLDIARAAPGSKLVENLIADKDKLSSIVFRRKIPEQREQLCARRIIATRNELNRKLESVLKLQTLSSS